jgi:hypothetical protein
VGGVGGHSRQIGITRPACSIGLPAPVIAVMTVMAPPLYRSAAAISVPAKQMTAATASAVAPCSTVMVRLPSKSMVLLLPDAGGCAAPGVAAVAPEIAGAAASGAAAATAAGASRVVAAVACAASGGTRRAKA